MNTLEMAIELRKNPTLKAMCVVGNAVWKVKCVNGSIMWEDNTRRSEFLDMSDYVLRYNHWCIYKEENNTIELYHYANIELDNGIGTLPSNKKIIGDIYVETLDKTVHTIRPIGQNFAVPTDDKFVKVYFKYKCNGVVITIKNN